MPVVLRWPSTSVFFFLLEVILVLYPEYKLECILKHRDTSLGLPSFNAEMCCCFFIPSSVRSFLYFLNSSFCFCEVHEIYRILSSLISQNSLFLFWKTEWRTCLWLNMVLHCCKYHRKHMCFVNHFIYERMIFFLL